MNSFMASAFPLLGIVYTMMAETISEIAAEEKQEKAQQMNALAELAKQTRLPVATLRRALTNSGTRINPSTLLTATNHAATEPAATATTAAPDVATSDVNRPITGQVLAIERDAINSGDKRNSGSSVGATPNEGNTPDKLQMTIEALRSNPDMTDEALAEYLSLKRPASARFWRLKAIEILNAPGRDQTGKTTAMRGTSPWPTPAGIANGSRR
jgi:hypothetical protein